MSDYNHAYLVFSKTEDSTFQANTWQSQENFYFVDHGIAYQNTMDDIDLWEEIRKGNEQTFKELFVKYYPQLVLFAHHLVGNESSAKDIAQDVFVKIWNQKADLKIKENIRSYLLKATRNTALNLLKKRQRLAYDEYPDLEDRTPSAQDYLQAGDLEKSIRKAIDALPPACRTVFLLRRMEGLSLKEIAAELQISVKTVENQLTKAQKSIMHHLKPMMSGINILILIYGCGL